MRNLTLNRGNKQEVKVALVTGSARRIGAAIAKHLHAAEFKVLIHCHSSVEEAEALSGDLNQIRKHSALVIQQELTKEHAPQELLETIRQWGGRLDVLVNNASVFIRSNDNEFNLDDWQKQFLVNVQVPYLLSIGARPFLSAVQGCIINITDIHAERPLKGYAVYCQTKAALEMQTKALARELAPEIRVNAVAPGAIAWPESDNTLSKEQQERIISKTALKRHGEPQFIAQAVLSLVQNPFITGQTIKVDGGRSIVG
jgi:pteridine reductase